MSHSLALERAWKESCEDQSKLAGQVVIIDRLRTERDEALTKLARFTHAKKYPDLYVTKKKAKILCAENAKLKTALKAICKAIPDDCKPKTRRL